MNDESATQQMHDGRYVHIVHRDFAVRDALARLMTVEGLGVKNMVRLTVSLKPSASRTRDA
jgi:hypothetical protein